MRFITWNLAVSTWLLVSAFVLPHSAGSAALSGLMAVLVATFALGSPGLRGLRFVNSALALVLFGAALLMPDMGWAARVNNALVAAVVFALSVVPGRSTHPGPQGSPEP